MRKAGTFVSFLALGLVAASAWAGSWSNYEASFPLIPCQDGWLGCIVDGEVHNSEMVKDSKGFLIPASARVGWHDLQPTGGFSPFPRLSKYSGQLQEAPPDDEPVVADLDDGTEQGGSAGSDSVEVENTDDNSMGGDAVVNNGSGMAGAAIDDRAVDVGGTVATTTDNTETTTTNDTTSNARENVTDSTTSDNSRSKEVATKTDTTGPSTDNTAGVRPKDTEPKTTDPIVKNDGVVALDTKTPNTATQPKNSILQSATPSAGASAESDNCDVLTKLEPKAMLGKLTKGQVACLEEKIGNAPKQTTKDKVSRILMSNAHASGDKRTWEKLVKRHLNTIDRSDPDLCYKYALHLSRKGPGRARGVIQWADVALENRFKWSGNTYKSRVYSLYKLKSKAGQGLWMAASEMYNGNPTPGNKTKMENARNDAKVMAREWLEYAREAGRDHTKALQLCVSAAGTEDYCGG